jgi:hypothetical protein
MPHRITLRFMLYCRQGLIGTEAISRSQRWGLSPNPNLQFTEAMDAITESHWFFGVLTSIARAQSS